ncbi:MAG TPA: TonB family protein [Bryobacteraceae bacterium]|jgi:protein TonB|nr:TonB family protein [Bryobacteraceae bacterium]
MSARTDILDEPERLRGPFIGSLVFHGGLVGIFAAATTFHFLGGNVIQLGDPHGGGFGSVAVTAVNSIQLPNRAELTNPVANDTKSQVPTAPPKLKALPKPKVTAPDPDAIPLKSHAAPKRVAQAASQPNKWEAQQHYRDNQLYSPTGAAASSPIYQIQGGGGVGLGTDSPLGTQYGYYANLLLNLIGQHWHPTTMDARTLTNQAVVQFTLLRDGSLQPGSVRLVQSSGNRDLDYSAQRALLDIDRFPPLPAGFPRDRADLQIHFDLSRH